MTCLGPPDLPWSLLLRAGGGGQPLLKGAGISRVLPIPCPVGPAGGCGCRGLRPQAFAPPRPRA